jgi:hypothetical protein
LPAALQIASERQRLAKSASPSPFTSISPTEAGELNSNHGDVLLRHVLSNSEKSKFGGNERKAILERLPIRQLQRSFGNQRLARIINGRTISQLSLEFAQRCTCEPGAKDACPACKKASEKPGENQHQRVENPESTQVSRASRYFSSDVIQRACLPASSCAARPGSATTFGKDVESAEKAARKRRAKMSPTRQVSTGHTGHARQLEQFMNAQAPGLLSNIHGIFIDMDMDASVEATKMDCADMVPPITGATKPCVFIHGHLNQEALTFNTDPSAATIGGMSREDWRVSTVQTFTHEVQHVIYDTAKTGTAPPAGVACPRADVQAELSELNAILSEFPAVFDAVPAGAAASDPARVRLDNWFQFKITNPSESIRGTLKALDCKCGCSDTDEYVKETVAFVTAGWPPARLNALNAELKKSKWGLRWP